MPLTAGQRARLEKMLGSTIINPDEETIRSVVEALEDIMNIIKRGPEDLLMVHDGQVKVKILPVQRINEVRRLTFQNEITTVLWPNGVTNRRVEDKMMLFSTPNKQFNCAFMVLRGWIRLRINTGLASGFFPRDESDDENYLYSLLSITQELRGRVAALEGETRNLF